jgi:hypothetical protein
MVVVIITDMAQLCQYAYRAVMFLLKLRLSHIVIMFIFDASTLNTLFSSWTEFLCRVIVQCRYRLLRLACGKHSAPS